MLPADAGCIVDNVDTVYNVYRAVKLHKPLTERIVTVSGDGVKIPVIWKFLWNNASVNS